MADSPHESLAAGTEELLPIGQSPDHIELVTRAAEKGIEEVTVRNLLWRIRAPRTLPRFPVICVRIGRMLEAAVRAWKVSLRDWDMDGWPDVVAFVARERRRLAKSMGPEFDMPFRGGATDPFYGYLTHWAPYPSLGLDRATDDEIFLLAQAQLLFAYAHDAREHTTAKRYEECTEWFFERPLRDPRPASYAVRQLSHEGYDLDRVLQALPVHLRPDWCARELGYVQVPDHPWLIRLRDDLRNYLQLAHGQRSPRRGGRDGGGGGGGAILRGHVSYEADWWTAAHLGTDEDDPFAPPTDYSIAVRSSLELAARMEMKDSDECPAEYEGEEEITVEIPDPQAQRDPSSFTGLISGATRHIEMANQLLWFAYDVPTTHEIATVLRAAYMILRSHPRRATDRELLRLEIATLAIIMLATSAPLARAQSVYVCRADGANHDVDLTLILDDAQRAWWRMRAPVPAYGSESLDPNHTLFVRQPDMVHAEGFVRRLLRARGLGENTREGVQPFLRQPKTYQDALRKWLAEEVDPSKRTTTAKLPNFLFAHLVRRTGGDVADACFALAHWHELANVASYYATPSLARLQRLYIEMIADVRTAVRDSLLTPPAAMPLSSPGSRRTSSHLPTLPLNSKRVGNRVCPTRDAISALATQLAADIRHESRRDLEKTSVQGHNAYTLYSVQFLAAALGTRWPSSFMLSESDIDRDTGLAILREKTVRPSWLVDEAREHFRYYHEYLANWAPIPLPTFDGRLASCYLLTMSCEPVEVTPSTCATLLGDLFPFPANIYRRFVRNELREAGCPAEVVEAWLGHRPRGLETYHIYSQFTYGAYRQALSTYLEPILKKIGFKARPWKKVVETNEPE